MIIQLLCIASMCWECIPNGVATCVNMLFKVRDVCLYIRTKWGIFVYTYVQSERIYTKWGMLVYIYVQSEGCFFIYMYKVRDVGLYIYMFKVRDVCLYIFYKVRDVCLYICTQMRDVCFYICTIWGMFFYIHVQSALTGSNSWQVILHLANVVFALNWI